jgi:hypothetical protein
MAGLHGVRKRVNDAEDEAKYEAKDDAKANAKANAEDVGISSQNFRIPAR